MKKSYERTTLNDIAAGLKMTKGAVYWHFKSKEELMIAIVKNAEVKFKEFVEKRISDSPTFLEMAYAMEEIAEIIADDPKSIAFFKLIHLQQGWSSSMRKQLFQIERPDSYGVSTAFKTAIINDIKSERIKKVFLLKISHALVQRHGRELWNRKFYFLSTKSPARCSIRFIPQFGNL